MVLESARHAPASPSPQASQARGTCANNSDAPRPHVPRPHVPACVQGTVTCVLCGRYLRLHVAYVVRNSHLNAREVGMIRFLDKVL